MSKKNKLLIFAALIIPVLILFDLIICCLLYFFEPVCYHAPDLSYSDFSFEMYKKFSYDKDDNFYIKQISENDVVSVPEDERLKYVDDTIIIIANDNSDYEAVYSLSQQIGGEICGYIDEIDFYQITINDADYSQLLNICSVLTEDNLVKYAIIDYFEETPVSETSTERYLTDTDAYKYYYLDAIDAYTVWTLTENISSEITIGMLDIPVDYDNKYINVENKNDYDLNLFYNNSVLTSPSHGTHVAGIMSASDTSDTRGICCNASIYSDNAINNSISYWTAAIVNMIVNHDIKAINISMGYNSYIPVSASLGCEFSKMYIKNENDYFESFLGNLIQNGYDFLICVAAGNESGQSLYKTSLSTFSYGEKDILRKFDMFDIFSEMPEYCNAEFQLPLTSIDDPDVRSRIMIVGSVDYYNQYSDFASAGSAVDIVAPGENIYSTVLSGSYEYMSGTSMSTPIVTGSAALLFSIDDSLTGSEIKDILIQSADETVFAYGCNYPVLNIGNAVEYALNH